MDRTDRLSAEAVSGAPHSPTAVQATSIRTAFGCGALVFAVLVCWATATGRYGGPDEPAHVLRAYAVAHGDLLGAPAGDLPPGYRTVTVPVSIGTGDPACYRHDRTVDSSCAAPTGSGTVDVATSAGTNPPLYYALVGIPARLVGAADDPLAHRLVAALLVSIVLALLVLRARWRAPTAALALAVVTPSGWFLWGVVNPNSLEIALVALAAAGIVRSRPDAVTSITARPGSSAADVCWVAAPLGIAIAMRPVSALWAFTLLAVCELEWRGAVRARTRALLWGAPALGVASVVVWSWWSSLVVEDERTAGTGSTIDALRDSIGGLPRTGAELVASLGWLEYWAPWPAVAAWSAGVVSLVRSRPSLRPGSWAVLAAALVVVPVVFEVVLYDRVGLIWQGRYGLPVAAAAAVLALGSSTARPANGVARTAVVLAALVTTATFWAVSRRAAVGTDGSWFFDGAVRSSRLFGLGTWVIVHASLVAVAAAALLRAISSSAPAASNATGRAASSPPR